MNRPIWVSGGFSARCICPMISEDQDDAGSVVLDSKSSPSAIGRSVKSVLRVARLVSDEPAARRCDVNDVIRVNWQGRCS